MADVFISYKHDERERIAPIISGLESLGLSVWYDASIHSGERFAKVIVAQLKIAKAIMVCWSPLSCESEWVREEADVGREQETLVPCFIEKCKPMPPFTLIHAADLTDWSGSHDHSGWQNIVERIGQLVERPGLLPLARALASNSTSDFAAWARSYPNDPFVENICETWAELERASFKKQIEDCRKKLDDHVKTRRSVMRGRLTNTEKEFEKWIAKGKNANPANRPDPSGVLDTLVAPDGDAPSFAELEAALATAEERAAVAEGLAAQLKEDLAALRPNTAEETKVENLPPPRRSSMLFIIALSATLGLAIGAATTRMLSGPSTAKAIDAQNEITGVLDELTQSKTQVQALTKLLAVSQQNAASNEAALMQAKSDQNKAKMDLDAVTLKLSFAQDELNQLNKKTPTMESTTKPAMSSSSTSCYVSGLDPKGFNWLALRFGPNDKSKWSETHMGPNTHLTVLGRSGEYLHVMLDSGETGWASSKHVDCGN